MNEIYQKLSPDALTLCIARSVDSLARGLTYASKTYTAQAEQMRKCVGDPKRAEKEIRILKNSFIELRDIFADAVETLRDLESLRKEKRY